MKLLPALFICFCACGSAYGEETATDAGSPSATGEASTPATDDAGASGNDASSKDASPKPDSGGSSGGTWRECGASCKCATLETCYFACSSGICNVTCESNSDCYVDCRGGTGNVFCGANSDCHHKNGCGCNIEGSGAMCIRD